jgi:hypothetical protein
VTTQVAALPVRGLPVGRGLCPGSEVVGAGVPGQEPFQRLPGQGLPAVAPAFVEVDGEVGQLVQAGHPGGGGDGPDHGGGAGGVPVIGAAGVRHGHRACGAGGRQVLQRRPDGSRRELPQRHRPDDADEAPGLPAGC